MIEVTFMSTNNEIEFKQILDQDTYSKIYELYFKNQSPFKQTNFYIDTENFKLKQHQAALRIRVKDYMYEMTLKVPAEVGLTEYNHSVNIEPELDMSLQLSQLPNDIRNILEQDFNILENELKVLGNLTTYRLETDYQNELLVLDKSEYLGKTDYELEFEVHSYDEGYSKFKSLLQHFNLQHQKPLNKVQRFFQEKQNASDKE